MGTMVCARAISPSEKPFRTMTCPDIVIGVIGIPFPAMTHCQCTAGRWHTVDPVRLRATNDGMDDSMRPQAPALTDTQRNALWRALWSTGFVDAETPGSVVEGRVVLHHWQRVRP